MLNVLVTGASGFIGKYLIDYLNKTNLYNVHAIGRRNTCECDNYCCMDIADTEFLTKAVDKIPRCEVIIHLAACIKMNESSQLINTNCMGTYNICQLVNAWQCEKVIYMSSIPVIGVPLELPITETHAVNPKTLYHITKYSGEQMINTCVNSDICKMILRIPSPIGVGMNPNTFLPVIIDRCMNNEDIVLYGKGLRRQNYVDVRDVVGAIVKMISYNKSSLFNIAGASAISNIELANKCIELMGSGSKIIFSGIEDKEENNKWDICIDKAQKELGYFPEYTIDKSIEWISGKVRYENDNIF